MGRAVGSSKIGDCEAGREETQGKISRRDQGVEKGLVTEEISHRLHLEVSGFELRVPCFTALSPAGFGKRRTKNVPESVGGKNSWSALPTWKHAEPKGAV